MTTDEALALPQPAPDHRLSYGPHELQFGELVAPGSAAWPTVRAAVLEMLVPDR